MKKRNKTQKALNGNKKKKKASVLKLDHWNKGPSHLVRKVDEIRLLLENRKPAAIGLSELNVMKGDKEEDLLIKPSTTPK